MNPLKISCGYGFNCKAMTGFASDSCPNLIQCAHAQARRHTQIPPTCALPWHTEQRDSICALVVSPKYLLPELRAAGWASAWDLFYEYKDSCLMIQHRSLLPSTATQLGWAKSEYLPYFFNLGLIVVVQTMEQQECGWREALPIPYQKKECCLIVNTYSFEAWHVGWQPPTDLEQAIKSLLYDELCPNCGHSRKLNEVVFGANSWYECAHCLWHGGFRINRLLSICEGFISDTGVLRSLFDDHCCPGCGEFMLSHYQDMEMAWEECQNCL